MYTYREGDRLWHRSIVKSLVNAKNTDCVLSRSSAAPRELSFCHSQRYQELSNVSPQHVRNSVSRPTDWKSYVGLSHCQSDHLDQARSSDREQVWQTGSLSKSAWLGWSASIGLPTRYFFTVKKVE